jgi:hypothetical protein
MKTARWGLQLFAAAVVAVASVAPPARADDTDKEKDKAAATEADLESHYPPPSTRWKVMGAGLFMVAGAYAIGFACAEEWPYINPTLQPSPPTASHPLIPSGPPETKLLKIPIAGPWIALGNLGCGSDQNNCGPATGARVAAYIIDGIVQAGGLALIAEGIFMKTESAAPKASAFMLRRGGFELKPVPVLSPTMQGIGMAGTF